MLSAAHLLFSVISLILGACILARPKGTRWHIWAGRLYVFCMITLNLAAFGIYHLTGHFNLFHLTALLSLFLVLTGWTQVLFRRRLRNWLYRHYMYMSWSYVALVAAAVNESFVRLPFLKTLLGQVTGRSWLRKQPFWAPPPSSSTGKDRRYWRAISGQPDSEIFTRDFFVYDWGCKNTWNTTCWKFRLKRCWKT